ncbi:DUF4249 domain-containing protein [Flavobacterium humi]|uniref:DUF4249 domain-containing protein n=1 Tax=Flavobacterium humi TaxID=2562683 RepID=A0A4Z0LB13_9FLAO|nr:DUF4249 domain-containing protein [Flavobacterium humi]TGD59063.1 DUF4249 domain-containing protein [Flavobacterium humi]
MKNILTYSIAIIASIFFMSCEDVVNVDLDTAPPKLVIDAAIKWEKGTSGNEQKIKLTTTTGFYNSTIPSVSGATVFITNSSNTVFNFIETPNTGEYICTNFIPVINENYTLTVIHDGQTYTATDKLYASPDIDNIEQGVFPGIGEDQIQVKFYYQDNGAEDNFYLLGFKNSNIAFPEYGVAPDEFFQGNQMFGFYTDEDLKPNDVLDLSLQGISERYSNYMTKLLNIAGTNEGNPFTAPPATLRGNIINQTSKANFPLGYFSLGEVDTDTYVVQ